MTRKPIILTRFSSLREEAPDKERTMRVSEPSPITLDEVLQALRDLRSCLQAWSDVVAVPAVLYSPSRALRMAADEAARQEEIVRRVDVLLARARKGRGAS